MTNFRPPIHLLLFTWFLNDPLVVHGKKIMPKCDYSSFQASLDYKLWSMAIKQCLITSRVYYSQLSRKITGIEKIFKTWDLYQSILYTLEYCFLKKTKFLTRAFFSTDRLVVLAYRAK